MNKSNWYILGLAVLAGLIGVWILPSHSPKVSNEASEVTLLEKSKTNASHVATTATAAPAGTDEPSFTLEQVQHRFGTDPDIRFLPETAIDTDQVPNIVLSESDPDDKPLPFYPIAPDTYMLFGNIAEVDGNNRGFNGNAGFVVTESGVVVIDALGTPKLGKRLIATIRKVTSQPIRYLIITHNHPDHAYGAVAFRELGGVTIIAHPGTLDYLGSDRLARSLAYRRTFIAPDMEGFQAVEPDFLVRVPRYENYSFRAGEQTFRVYNTGHHHSHGDLVVYQENAGIVWISDLAFNDRVTFIGDGSSNEAIESLDWLKTAFPEAKLMVPGHGSAQTPPFPMIDRTRDYIQRMRDLMAQAVEEGLGMQEAVDQAELPDWQKVRLYDLNQRPNANFIFREMEAELF